MCVQHVGRSSSGNATWSVTKRNTRGMQDSFAAANTSIQRETSHFTGVTCTVKRSSTCVHHAVRALQPTLGWDATSAVKRTAWHSNVMCVAIRQRTFQNWTTISHFMQGNGSTGVPFVINSTSTAVAWVHTSASSIKTIEKEFVVRFERMGGRASHLLGTRV